MVSRILSVLRSMAFYPVFYLGSIPYVVWAVVVYGLSQDHFRRTVRGWCNYHRFCCRVLLGIRPVLVDPQMRGGVIYAIKHESFFEAIDMPALFDLPVVFAKAELTRLPLWGRAAVQYGIVPVEREAGAKALRAMVGAARKWSATGRPLVIFPEGTRVPHGQQPELQAGFAGLYKLMNLPVIPVAVDSGRLYHRWFKLPGPVHYQFGEEIPAGLPREEVEARVRAAMNALNPPA